ncbi:MAG: epimerase [Deltaproteobacteria bacterium RIFCSPLOWO2_01_44_7]|nr:MAG: epimerase [Deltaproteobacteria bacterium RIFCSPHIGHO2_01_FULL_43_49]OGQ16146.1 MAG: epimerase [Deltaproteobacteria bacterium RIFCSPHIGHO2_02_FULL_44_53]OGQ29107.1 MAG: epimerase [Deltaproteobacteria bacterium RIFCSPHIGHO2_12_FULL_44_21]OGQ32663.1 MAG: epimerase [Deltaproteobacteria bacterium RIFCSPLOWO2_01_FULL_45_74]OGQ41090.1 MAG: epimerase [Deltaproteobacteria bacterium RIFCSPLOWO2_01_44_7]OGQ41764.1 MAG: epimerase [Deltaproteobacteria bacterium RIFCSPLOWO2_02_FULL_44_34]OGQ71764.1
MNPSPSKVFITGGAGFIGSNVAKYFLERNHSVVIFDNLSTGYMQNIPSFLNVQFVKGDIRDKELLTKSMAGCEAVLHLAAAVGNIRSIENTVEDSEINVLGTLHVLDVARHIGIRKIVYSSSAAIFGELKRLPIDEEHPTTPDSPYGVSKLAGELHCLCYAKLYGMDIVCLRYFNVYGPNQCYDAYGNVIPIFSTRKLKGEPFVIYGDGEQTRDFVHVFDIAQANYLGTTLSNVGGIYNVGAGQSITINQLADMMNEIGDQKPVPIQHVPARKGEVKHSLATIEKAKKILGYQPTQTIQAGLKGYWEWIQSVS